MIQRMSCTVWPLITTVPTSEALGPKPMGVRRPRSALGIGHHSTHAVLPSFTRYSTPAVKFCTTAVPSPFSERMAWYVTE